jgi:hypothetical protein
VTKHVSESPITDNPARSSLLVEYLALGFAVVVTALLAAALVIRLDDNSAASTDAHTRRDAISAAASGAVALLSYDYRTIANVAQTNRPLLTSDCAAGYLSQIDGGVKAQVIASKVVVEVSGRSSAVQSIAADRALVLVVVNSKRTGSDVAQPQNDQLAVSVSLSRAGGRWLVADVVPAGTPAGTDGSAVSAHPCS